MWLVCVFELYEETGVCCGDGNDPVLENCRSSCSMLASRLSMRMILFSLQKMLVEVSAVEESDSLLFRNLDSVFVSLWSLRRGPAC